MSRDLVLKVLEGLGAGKLEFLATDVEPLADGIEFDFGRRAVGWGGGEAR